MVEIQQRYVGSSYRDNNPQWHSEDAAWKADAIASMLRKHSIIPESILDVGCGTGGVLSSLMTTHFPNARGVGYDIASYPLTLSHTSPKLLELINGDVTQSDVHGFDVLLCMDVMEHIEDYMGFLRKLHGRAEYSIFHIPLDLDMRAVLRSRHMRERREVGHLHYFDKSSALATLRDTGFQVLDSSYTTRFDSYWKARVLSLMSGALRPFIGLDMRVRLFGAHSLLVLARSVRG